MKNGIPYSLKMTWVIHLKSRSLLDGRKVGFLVQTEDQRVYINI
jgi:hypothetical protein